MANVSPRVLSPRGRWQGGVKKVYPRERKRADGGVREREGGGRYTDSTNDYNFERSVEGALPAREAEGRHPHASQIVGQKDRKT